MCLSYSCSRIQRKEHCLLQAKTHHSWTCGIKIFKEFLLERVSFLSVWCVFLVRPNLIWLVLSLPSNLIDFITNSNSAFVGIEHFFLSLPDKRDLEIQSTDTDYWMDFKLKSNIKWYSVSDVTWPQLLPAPFIISLNNAGYHCLSCQTLTISWWNEWGSFPPTS